MPGAAYILLKGIDGESKTVGKDKNIECESYSFGASNPANLGSNGLSGGTVSLSDFSFTCEVDASSAQILNQLYNGKPVDSAVFTLQESGGGANPYDYITVTFTNCYITSQACWSLQLPACASCRMPTLFGDRVLSHWATGRFSASHQTLIIQLVTEDCVRFSPNVVPYGSTGW